jgi:hypothetical protein
MYWYVFPKGRSGRGVKLSTHRHLVYFHSPKPLLVWYLIEQIHYLKNIRIQSLGCPGRESKVEAHKKVTGNVWSVISLKEASTTALKFTGSTEVGKLTYSLPLPSSDGFKFAACQSRSRRVTCSHCVRKCHFLLQVSLKCRDILSVARPILKRVDITQRLSIFFSFILFNFRSEYILN